jgi:SAM-dependent methyltransferase
MSSAVEPAIVLAAYAEPVVNGRRVLFIGPASSMLPERLLERGARLIHVCDPDPIRLGEATAKNRSRNVSFSALTDGHFALRDGAFDVCLVEDAGIAEPAKLLRAVRRALTPRGVAIVASPNAEAKAPLLPHRSSGVVALDYYALYDAVKEEFEHVRMLGQAPFVGYVVAEFAPEGSPEPSLDTAFVPGGAEEPELFVAVASQQPVDLEPFAVVQLPYRSVVGAGSGGNAADAEQLRQARTAEQVASTRIAELEKELAAARQTAGEREAKLREAETRVFARDAELSGLRQELDNKTQWLKAHEASVAELQQKLQRGASPEDTEAAAAELTALETALQERGEHVRQLERQLRESERTGKELLRQLPGATQSAPALTLPKNPDTEALAQKLAKSQADLIATRWALEAAVRRAPTTDSPEA